LLGQRSAIFVTAATAAVA